MDGAAPLPTPNGDAPPPAAEPMSLKFQDSSGFEVHFKLKSTTRLGKAMEAFSAKVEKPMGSLRFLFEGDRVLADHTPADFNMGEGDTVEVHMEQIGGGEEEHE